jgi:hypothetical protein
MDQMGDMSDTIHEDIMKKANAKFDLLMNRGKWGTRSLDQEKIIALEAQVHKHKDLKLSAQLIHKLKEDGKEQREGDSTGQDEENNQANGSNKHFQNQDTEWMKMLPKDDEPKHEHVGKKTWHWCVHHMKWTVHNKKTVS